MIHDKNLDWCSLNIFNLQNPISFGPSAFSGSTILYMPLYVVVVIVTGDRLPCGIVKPPTRDSEVQMETFNHKISLVKLQSMSSS